MKLSLHPSASKSFDDRIVALIPQFRVKDQLQTPDVKTNSDVHVSAVFNEENIIEGPKPFWRNASGKVAARGFYVRGKLIGMFGEDYEKLSRIAEDIERAINPHNAAGADRISELIFEWAKRKWLASSTTPMTEFVLSELAKEVDEIDVWIPISNLHIQSPFTLGAVTFRLITKKFMDGYQDEMAAHLTEPEDLRKLQLHFERKRSEIQGRAVSVSKVVAEPEKAYQVALENTEKALSVLRFYSSANLYPTMTCYSAPVERQHLDANVYMIVKNGRVLNDVSGNTDKSFKPWVLKNEDLHEYSKAGLGVLSSMLIAENLTDFQRKVMEALSHYSTSALSKDISGKLVNLLVAVETVFLKDSSEPIQENISTRIALMHPVTSSQRRDIAANVRETYGLRSAFVHHGKSISTADFQTLKAFMWNVWIAFNGLFPRVQAGITCKEFFDELETAKFSG